MRFKAIKLLELYWSAWVIHKLSMSMKELLHRQQREKVISCL